MTSPVTIRDIQTIMTQPQHARLVVVKVLTSEPGLYGVGCASFWFRNHAVYAALENHLTTFDNLRLQLLRYTRRSTDPDGVLDRLELTRVRNERAGRLSQGERQRLGLALALVLEPELLVLDEPLAHLDPSSSAIALEVLRHEVRERGTTVLLSSHHLSQVEHAADHLALLHRGRLLLSGSLRELLTESRRLVRIEATPKDRLAPFLADHPLVVGVEETPRAEQLRVELREDSPQRLNADLHQAGFEVRVLAPEAWTLEELFRQATRAADRGEALP